MLKLQKKDSIKYLTAALAVLMFAAFAHAYWSVNYTPFHDSLTEFYAERYNPNYGYTIRNLKLATGRFLEPVYWDIFRGNVTLPWLSGLVGFFWLTLALFLIIRIFEINKTGIILLIAGIFVTNVTITSTLATYFCEFEVYAFSILFAVLAVYFWSKGKQWFWAGIPCLFVSLAIYQAYIALTLSLVMILSVVRLLRKQSCREVFREIGKAAAFIAIGAGLYFLTMKLIQAGNHVSMKSDYTFEFFTNPFFSLRKCYGKYLRNFSFVKSGWPRGVFIGLNLGVLLITGVSIFQYCLDKSVRKSQKIAVICICILLPACMNIWELLTGGKAHDLMYLAVWMTYAYAILIVSETSEYGEKLLAPRIRLIAVSVLLGLVIFGNIRFSNTVYYERKLKADQTQSLMTRVLQDINDTEGYKNGETPVAFVGLPDIQKQEFFPETEVVGLDAACPITCVDQYSVYLKYILNVSMNCMDINDELYRIALLPEVVQMPSYPDSGSIAFLDDILIVKMQNQKQ